MTDEHRDDIPAPDAPDREHLPALKDERPDVRAMHFPRSGAHRQPGVRWAAAAIAFTAAILILLQNINIFPTPQIEETEPESLIVSPQLTDPVLISSKLMLGAFELPFLDADTKETINKLVFAEESQQDLSAIDLLRMAILRGVAVDPASGIEMLSRAEERIERRTQEVANDATLSEADRETYAKLFDEVSSDIAFVRTVLTESLDAVDAYDLDQFTTRHGWFGRLLKTYGTEKGRQQRKLMAAQGARAFLILFVMITVVVCAFVVGCILAFVAWFANFQGHLHWRMRHPKGPIYLYAETFALFLGSFLALIVVTELAMLGASEKTAGVIGVLRMLAQAGLALLCFYPFFRTKRPDLISRDIGWHTGKGLTSEIFAGIIGYFAGLPIIALGVAVMALLVSVVSAFSDGSGGSGPTHPIVESYTRSSIEIFIAYFFAVIWAPFVEETMFRGYFFTYLRNRHGFILSGLLTAFVFAAIHPQGWMFIPALGSIGYVMAMLREWRGSLIAPMVAHAMHNATLVTFGVLLFKTLM
ncbi:MAG: CPBP family intramembrane metalloprotease [Phycisphaeraceae bacterium]|nr:CPBP family intramembrane metalloprotease [Phycisphaerales bacterium]MCB9859772.1 CPBP family intramembrane metalloprotease [Phycisphaeraceae bacterium]